MTNQPDNGAGTFKRNEPPAASITGGQNSGPHGTGPQLPRIAKRWSLGWFSRRIHHPLLQLSVLMVGLSLVLLIPTELFGKDKGSVFSQIFESGPDGAQVPGWIKQVTTMIFRLAFAALLATALAFRPRKALPISHRNPYVMQTQILLAVVGAALMMIVADNAARAFGIFAAASLIRFRTKIRDPKEITVLLVNLGIGLAAGVGRWELAMGLTLFVFLLLQLLERHEASQVLRAVELKIKTHDVDATDQALRYMFERNDLKVATHTLNLQGREHRLGKIVYRMEVSPAFSTDQWAEEIRSSDPVNIDSIEWHQKKAASGVDR